MLTALHVNDVIENYGDTYTLNGVIYIHYSFTDDEIRAIKMERQALDCKYLRITYSFLIFLTFVFYHSTKIIKLAKEVISAKKKNCKKFLYGIKKFY